MQTPTRRATGQWYSIQNKAQGPTQVMIYDQIGGYGIHPDDFVNDLRQIKGDIELHLNTGGGSAFDGVTIYNALKSHPGKKTVTVDGLAASIGSVIAMAGDEVYMAPGSQMMIHDGFTECVGSASDLIHMADRLDKTSNDIAGFYESKTGTPAEQWRNLMQQNGLNGTWFSAKEAVDAGLADGLVEYPSISNSIIPDASQTSPAELPQEQGLTNDPAASLPEDNAQDNQFAQIVNSFREVFNL